MWLVISVSFVTFTAVLGITEILRRFWLFIMRPKDTPPAAMVIKLKEDFAVQQLRYTLEFISWERKGDFSHLAVILSELSEKTYSEVKKIVDSRNDVVFIKDSK